MIHHVYANQSNIGDWLSARGIQSLLRPEEIVEHYCDAPFVSHTLECLDQLRPSDLVVIGGGGLFMDYFVPFWRGLLELGNHVRYCIWGVGYCDLKREPSRPETQLLEEVVRRSIYCYVRDDLTRQLLANCSLPRPTGCPSLSVVRAETAAGWGLLHVDNYTTAGTDVYDAMEILGAQFAEQTDRAFRRTNNRIEFGDESALDRTLALYRQADLVLSSALHGCVVAAAMGKKIVAVSGDRKMESFMRLIGLEEWVCDQSEIDLLPQRLAKVAEQPTITERLDRIRQANTEIAELIRAASDISAPGSPGDHNNSSQRET